MSGLRRIFDRDGGSIDLTFTDIPDPTGLAAVGFVGAALLARRRAGQNHRADREVIA